MLVLSRRIGETLTIGGDVTVTVISCGNAAARIGISAPKEIPVHREEIYNRIARERAQANDTLTKKSE